MAEEKYETLLQDMTNQHMFGDIQKATREELVKIGSNPITKQAELSEVP